MADKKLIDHDKSYSTDSSGKKHDDLSDPVPHKAARKSVVDKVLDGLIGTGNGIVSLVAGLLAVTLVLYSGYVLVDTLIIQQNAQKSSWDLMAYKPEVIDDYNTALSGSPLAAMNKDYRAWLTVYDTNIDYPVVQGENDLYYASHDIYRQNSLTGAIYMAAGNSGDFSDSYNLIYGHHMDNKAMFGSLDAFTEESYFRSHKTGIVVAPSGIYDIEFFAVINTDAYESRVYSVGDRMGEVLSFLESGGEGGVGAGTSVLLYDSAVAAGAEKVIALSTCASAETSGRLVVFGTMKTRNLMTLEAAGYEGIYDGKAHSLSSVTVNYPEDGLIEYSLDGENWTEEMPSITDAGTLDVRVRVTSTAYGSANTMVQLVVHPRTVVLTAGSEERMYNGRELKNSVITITGDGFAEGEGADASTSGSRIYVGSSENGVTYTLRPGTKLSNYIITTVPGILSVNPAPVVITTGSAQKQYDGLPLTCETASVIGLAAGETVTIRATGSVTEEGSAFNTYEIVWDGADASNYVVVEQIGTLTVTPAGNPTDPAEFGGEGLPAPPEDTIPVSGPFSLTINYISLEGDILAPAYTGELESGSYYSVVSPEVEGFTALRTGVDGTITGDTVINVFYVPVLPAEGGSKGDEYVIIDEFGTPLGLGTVYINTGDCWD